MAFLIIKIIWTLVKLALYLAMGYGAFRYYWPDTDPNVFWLITGVVFICAIADYLGG